VFDISKRNVIFYYANDYILGSIARYNHSLLFAANKSKLSVAFNLKVGFLTGVPLFYSLNKG
jgi:hypothetical protein